PQLSPLSLHDALPILELPALKAVNQPVTLLTNSVSFREYGKAWRFLPPSQEGDEPQEKTVQLTRRVFATGAFSQFTYRNLVNIQPTEEVKDDFDSVWQKN